MSKNILIAGDSFAADWPNRNCYYPSWVDLLRKNYQINNVAQAGCSEYKIFKQLENLDMAMYDLIITVHTSPFRIPVETHPLHKNNEFHSNCDLIYQDLKKNNNQYVSCLVEYFEKYYWIDHSLFVYKCTIEQQQKILSSSKCLHLTFLSWDQLINFNSFIDLNYLFVKYPGRVNHLSCEGNFIAYTQVKKWIDQQ